MYTHLQHKIAEAYPEWKDDLVKNTLLMVCLVLSERTVNLWKLKDAVGRQLGNVDVDPRSHYQRLKRWLWAGADNQLWVLILQASCQLLTGSSQWLIVDGTSWQSGGQTYHFLTLSLLYRDVSIPIWWVNLRHLGQSSQWHRRLLIRTASRVLRLSGKILIGDREYIGLNWFETLKEYSIEMVIRLRKKDYLTEIEATGRKVANMEKQARTQVGKPCWKKVSVGGRSYYFVMVAYQNRLKEADILRLLTTVTPAKAVEGYQLRYRIESMFKHLKSNGFEIEDMNVKIDYKVQMLMAIAVLSYTLAVIYGLVDFHYKIAKKKHACWEMSVFRWGLAKWQKFLSNYRSFCRRMEYYFDKYSIRENHFKIAHVP